MAQTQIIEPGLIDAKFAEVVRRTSVQVTDSINLTTIAANAAASTTVTVPDAAAGDIVTVVPHTNPNNAATWSGFVSAANTVTIRVANNSGSAIDPAATRFTVKVEHLGKLV